MGEEIRRSEKKVLDIAMIGLASVDESKPQRAVWIGHSRDDLKRARDILSRCDSQGFVDFEEMGRCKVSVHYSENRGPLGLSFSVSFKEYAGQLDRRERIEVDANYTLKPITS